MTFELEGLNGISVMYLCNNVLSAEVEHVQENTLVTVPLEGEGVLRQYLDECGYLWPLGYPCFGDDGSSARERTTRQNGAGKRLCQLARGELPHLFQPVEPVFRLEEHMELDPPVEDREALLFVVNVR